MSGKRLTSVGSVISKVFGERSSLTLGFAALLVTIALIYISPNLAVSATYFIPIVVLLIFVIWIARACIEEALSQSPKLIPKVETSRLVGADKQDLILLLEPNELFGNETRVSIFQLNDDGFEIRLAHGMVLNVQGDGRIQVIIEQWEQAQEGEIEKLSNGNKAALDRLIVRPSVAINTPANFNQELTYDGTIVLNNLVALLSSQSQDGDIDTEPQDGS